MTILTYWHFTTQAEPNDPPGAPTITGPTTGKTGESLTYTFNAVDPDGDDVRFIIDWGDSNNYTTTFIGSGIDKTVTNSWDSEGTYTITAHAEDEFGLAGPSATYTVTIPRDKAINRLFLNWLHSHPNLLPILQKLIQQHWFGL